MTTWPAGPEREEHEIAGFITAYSRFAESRRFEVVAKREMPDYIVRDVASGEELGVELTSVYLDDRSVPDVHMSQEDRPVETPDDPEQLERYCNRLAAAIIGKICKARQGYDRTRPLILAIYVNEYISIYLREAELQEFVGSHGALFEAMTPFSEVVFWNLPNGGAFRARPGSKRA